MGLSASAPRTYELYRYMARGMNARVFHCHNVCECACEMQKWERERSDGTTVDDIKGIIIMLLNMIHIIFFRSRSYIIIFFFLSLVPVHSKNI